MTDNKKLSKKELEKTLLKLTVLGYGASVSANKLISHIAVLDGEFEKQGKIISVLHADYNKLEAFLKEREDWLPVSEGSSCETTHYACECQVGLISKQREELKEKDDEIERLEECRKGDHQIHSDLLHDCAKKIDLINSLKQKVGELESVIKKIDDGWCGILQATLLDDREKEIEDLQAVVERMREVAKPVIEQARISGYSEEVPDTAYITFTFDEKLRSRLRGSDLKRFKQALPQESRSIQRRKAAQKGEPIPEVDKEPCKHTDTMIAKDVKGYSGGVKACADCGFVLDRKPAILNTEEGRARAERFFKLNDEALKKSALEITKPPCPDCGGSKIRERCEGYSTFTTRCPTCKDGTREVGE